MPINKSQSGQTFAELADQISSKYSERYDPISMRGLKSEMTDLKDHQEVARAKKFESDAKASNMGKILAFGGPTNDNDPKLVARAKEVLSSLNGTSDFSLGAITPEKLAQLDTMSNERINNLLRSIPSQKDMNPDFSRTIKESFPDLFPSDRQDAPDKINVASDRANAGISDALNAAPTELGGLEQTSRVAGEGEFPENGSFDPTNLRYAPVAFNALNLLNKNSETETAPVNTAAPQQTRFDKVDTSGVERGITERGRAFTQTNAAVSGGNAAGFLSNELASQINQLRATGEARLQGQVQDRQTDQLNAGEQGRVDQFNANIQSENNRMSFATNDINARNRGASQNIKSSSLAQIGTDLGNIGKEEFFMDQVKGYTGYDPRTLRKSAYGGYLMGKLKKKK